jgi:hypothetical protein
LTKNLSEFDKLCESVNFKKMEKEELSKLYSKKKWLQKSSTFLNQLILKDMDDDDEDGSEKDSKDSDSDSEKDSEEEEESEEEEDGGCKFKFSQGSTFKVEKNKISKIGGSAYDIIASKTGKKFKVKIGTTSGWMGLGAISESNIKSKQFLLNTGNIQGFYIWSCNGYLW